MLFFGVCLALCFVVFSCLVWGCFVVVVLVLWFLFFFSCFGVFFKLVKHAGSLIICQTEPKTV